MPNTKQYLWQKMSKTETDPTTWGNYTDAARNYRDRHLSNAELIVKVKEEIVREKTLKAFYQERTPERCQHDWNKFLNSKLVTKPYFK